MKFLTCLFCDGELELLNPFEKTFSKKVKCKKCGFTSDNKKDKKENLPEVTFIRRK